MGSRATVEARRWDLPVLENRHLGGNCRELVLDAPELSAVVRAGQFVNVLACKGNDPLLRRPFSIYRADRRAGTISVLYEVVGQGTSLIARWQPGDRADVLGPLGNWFVLPEGDGPVALVGGGIGVAPLVALARETASTGRRMHALLGARSASLIHGEAELRTLGALVEIATDDGSRGFHGFVSSLLEAALRGDDQRKPLRPDALFVCGPRPMMAAVAGVARAFGIPCRVSMEVGMACGFGVCMGCAWPMRAEEGDPAQPAYRLVCVDGPVFDAEEVLWEPREEPAGECACGRHEPLPAADGVTGECLNG